VIYDGVDMMALETHEYYFEAVYDDSTTDYLYTRVSLIITAIVNGQLLAQIGPDAPNGPVMSYQFDGSQNIGMTVDLVGANGGGVVRSPTVPVPPTLGLSVPGPAGLAVGKPIDPPRGIRFIPATPFSTLAAVRHRLSTPRGQLFVFSGRGMETGVPGVGTSGPPGGQISGLAGAGIQAFNAPLVSEINLASPTLQSLPSEFTSPEGNGRGLVRPCDCKNGPFPKIFGVTQVMSQDNTFVVDWGVETFINEAPENNVNPSGALLSNRFKQTHSIDDKGYTSIRTEGLAIFRTDLVMGAGQNPDSFRAVLFMPIPQGFTRVIEYVDGREDVSGIGYAYIDTQVPVNFVAGPYTHAASIVALHRQAVSSSTDLLTGALSVYDRILSIKQAQKYSKPDPTHAPVPPTVISKKKKTPVPKPTPPTP
jgi:hypothetical protein